MAFKRIMERRWSVIKSEGESFPSVVDLCVVNGARLDVFRDRSDLEVQKMLKRLKIF